MAELLAIIKDSENLEIIFRIILFLSVIWNLYLYICLCSIIIYGARVLRTKSADCKESATKDLAFIVKCLMTEGKYYFSTTSAEPLYEGEKPSISFDATLVFEFDKFCKILEKEGHKDWVNDLRAKREEYLKEKHK